MIEVVDAIDRQVLLEWGARAVLLPDEPYLFGVDDAKEFSRLSTSEPLHAELVDGKDLFWFGTRVAVAIERLSERIHRIRSNCFGA